jgi:hypothetical protein
LLRGKASFREACRKDPLSKSMSCRPAIRRSAAM